MGAEGGGAALLVEERDGGIVLATLNRPQANNAVSFEMWEAFSALLDRLENGTPPRALVMRGAGSKLFSTGGDMKIPPHRGEGALAPAARLEMGQRVIERLRRLPAPVIAAVEGGAFGMGWGIMLAADVVIASEAARFGAPFVDYGTVPDGGSVWFLTQRIGRHRAADLVFSGRTVAAAEALALGLVSRLVPVGTAADAALDYAAGLGKGNRQAVELAKRLLHQSEEGSLASALALELVYCSVCQTGPEVARARAGFGRPAPGKEA